LPERNSKKILFILLSFLIRTASLRLFLIFLSDYMMLLRKKTADPLPIE